MTVIFVGCKNQNKNQSKTINTNYTTTEIDKTVDKKSERNEMIKVSWSYEKDNTGPENWKNLSDDFSKCGGQSQSPVNISTNNTSTRYILRQPEFYYGKSLTNILNNGHTLQFNIEGDHSVKLNGKDYRLLQFHYHSLSEHTIDGEHMPLEVHFVHQHNKTDYAVIGVMYKEGKENPLLKSNLDKFPIEKEVYNSNKSIDLLEILPDNKSYYHYNGSLTTPPCNEVVNWYLLKDPIEASKKQLDRMSQILNNNHRPVQNLNGRRISFYLDQPKLLTKN